MWELVTGINSKKELINWTDPTSYYWPKWLVEFSVTSPSIRIAYVRACAPVHDAGRSAGKIDRMLKHTIFDLLPIQFVV